MYSHYICTVLLNILKNDILTLACVHKHTINIISIIIAFTMEQDQCVISLLQHLVVKLLTSSYIIQVNNYYNNQL